MTPLSATARLRLLLCPLLLGASLVASAAEPAPAISPAPTTPAAANPTAATTTSASATESPWLQSFPAEKRRPLTGYPGADTLLLWPPVTPWRGDLLLLPGPANSGRGASLLLPVADRLAEAGWRCWLLPREHAGPLAADTTLTAVLAVIRAEPAPANKAAGVAKPGLFLLAEADAATLALSNSAQQASAIAGTVLLTPNFPDASDTAPPTRPVLEIDRLPQTAAQRDAQIARSQRWQQQGQYQFHRLMLPAQADSSRWLSRVVDGWLRKTGEAAGQTAADDPLKKQMTAQPDNAGR